VGSNGKWEVGVCGVTCRPVNVGTFANMKVISANNALSYCDLISPQFFGSQYVRCLRTFIMPTTFCSNIFDKVYYMPVEKRLFRDMEIRIMNFDGAPVNFTAGNVPAKSCYIFDAFPSGNN
jgi:hypothetical protein